MNVLCQRRWPDGRFLVAQFKEETHAAKVDMMKKLFKFEYQQVISKLTLTGIPETKERSDKIEELFAQQRPAKRLKMQKTHEGQDL